MPGKSEGTTTVDYVIDAADRRVARRTNGGPWTWWLFHDQLNPVAEVDAAGVLRAHYVYATQAHVPDYVLTFDATGAPAGTYRVLTDQVGSVRVLVDLADGSVHESIEYTAFGRASAVSAVVPFGFAGGVHDAATGLVRFGARDYDPRTGRWTAKDPIRFGGGDALLYGYVAGDPIQLRDSTGLTVYLCRRQVRTDGFTQAALLFLEAFSLGTFKVTHSYFWLSKYDETYGLGGNGRVMTQERYREEDKPVERPRTDRCEPQRCIDEDRFRASLMRQLRLRVEYDKATDNCNDWSDRQLEQAPRWRPCR